MPYKFFFPYIGNKWDESKNIYKHICLDDIETIIEPFCGSCSFSVYGFVKLGVNDKKYILNDIDSNLINFIKDVKKGELKNYIDNCNSEAQKYYDDIKLWHIARKKKELKCGYEWFNIKRLSRGNMLKDFSYKNKENKHKEIDYHNYKLQESFFKSENVSLENEDYLKILEKYKNDESVLLFLDPPYIDSYNALYCGFTDTNHSYDIDNTKMYVDIINFIKTCKCKVAMVINENALTRYLFNDYIIDSYEKVYQLTKKKSRHIIVYKK